MKAVIDRAKSYFAVLRACRRWSRPAARSLAELLRPELAAGETLPDLVLLQKLFVRALTRGWRRVVAADEARVAARERRREAVAELDRKIRALYREVADLRSVLTGVFGAAAARNLVSFAGETARDPVALLRQANRVAARLRDRARPLPAASFVPTERQRDGWAAPLESAAKDLQTASDRASLAGRELEAAKVELRHALEDWNVLFLHVASWLTGTYRAAGRDEWAQAVRPSRWRKGLRVRDVSRAGRARAKARARDAAESDPASAGDGGERPLLRFAPVRQALRLLGGRSSEDEPRSAEAGAT